MAKRKRDKDGIYRRKDSPYWWASYIDASGRRARRSTGATEKREAEAILGKWRVEAHRQYQWDEQPERTFDELMVEYLKAVDGEKRDEVRDRNSLVHLQPFFTGRDLADITPVDIRGYIAERRGQGAAASTINREIGVLSAAMNYARRVWGWQYHNPAAQCRLREPEGRVRWLTREQVDQLIAAAEGLSKAPYLGDFIRLAVNTGCRRGELLGLEWERVDMAAGLIRLEARNTKGGKRRSVPLNDEARRALLGRSNFRAHHCPATPWVFAHANGERVTDVKKGFASACRTAGIRDFRVHDLRHTCAAWLVSAGVPLAEVRELLGHSSIKMTERYAHLAPDNVRAAVAVLDEPKSRKSHVEAVGKAGNER